MPNRINTGTFPEALKKTLHDVWSLNYEGDTNLEKVFHVEHTDDQYEDEMQYQLPTEIVKVGEGAAYPRVTIERGRTKRYTQATYKAELPITKEALKFNKYKELINGSAGLGEGVKETIQRTIAFYLLDSFSSEITPDGVSLFNTAHPILNPDPGCPAFQSNRLNLPLTPSSVKTGLRMLRSQLNDKGRIIGGSSDTQLIVGPSLEWTAREILESKQEAGTANNTKNVLPSIDLIVLDHFEEHSFGSEAWILRRVKRAKNKWLWSEEPVYEVLPDHETGGFLHRVEAMFAYGATDYRGFVGSLPQ